MLEKTRRVREGEQVRMQCDVCLPVDSEAGKPVRDERDERERDGAVQCADN